MRVTIEKVNNGFVMTGEDTDYPGVEVFEYADDMPALSADVPAFVGMCRRLQEHFGVWNDKHAGVFININYEYNKEDGNG